jgi:hypothetical protein
MSSDIKTTAECTGGCGKQIPWTDAYCSECISCTGQRVNHKPIKPLFESNASATIKRVEATFSQRGSEYGDTWANCQFLNMKAVAGKFGITIPDKFLRVLCVAGFCDMKYQRLEGGYKDDTIVDRVAYDAFLAEEVRRLERSQ